MSSFDCKLQGPGAFNGWSSIVGATDGYLACDDSATSSHDSDATYVVLPRQSTGQGIISFGAFAMVEHVVPTSVVVRVAAKTQSGSPKLEIGFNRGGQIAVDGTVFSTSGIYIVASRTFSTNPFTGPWADGDLQSLELLVRMQSGVVANARVTMMSATVNYGIMIDQYPPDPLCGVIGG